MTTVSALLTSVITSFIIFLIIYDLFVLLSRVPANSLLFYPARILSGRPLPEVKERGGLKWLNDVFNVSEETLAEIAGLDAAVYVRFQKVSLMIILWAAAFCVPVLIAVARSDNYYSTFNAAQTDSAKQLVYSDIDLLAMGNVQPQSNRLWGGAIAGWWVTIVTLYLLSSSYSAVVDLRATIFNKNPKLAAEQFTALVRDIPTTELSTESTVESFFSQIYDGDFLGSSAVPALGKASAAYKELLSLKQKLSKAEAAFEQSKTELEPVGKRPEHKIGFLGLIGEKVDSINWLSEQIAEKQPELKTKQEEAAAEASGAAFLFYKKRQVAASAAQSLHAETGDCWLVETAPEPRDVEWANLQMGLSQRSVRELMVYIFVFLLVCFFMIPIAFVSSLTTLDNLRKTLPFLGPIVDIPSLKAILEAFLPQLALIIFLALLPNLLVFLSRLEGLPSKSHIVRGACGKYFYFIVFNVFLGVTLSSSLFNSLQQVINQPSSIIDLLGSSLPAQSTFFITFVALKFFVSKGLELSRVVSVILFHVKKKYLCKTEYDILQAWAPGQLDYVSLLPNDMLAFTITVCYAVVAPLILLFGALYFVFSWSIMKNQVLNVYVPDWESNGRMWPHIHNRMVGSLVLAQITMIGFYAIKKFPYAVLLLPLPFVTLAYYFWAHGKFYRSFQDVSLEVASRPTEQEAPSVEELKKAYTVELMEEPEKIGLEFFEGGKEKSSDGV